MSYWVEQTHVRIHAHFQVLSVTDDHSPHDRTNVEWKKEKEIFWPPFSVPSFVVSARIGTSHANTTDDALNYHDHESCEWKRSVDSLHFTQTAIETNFSLAKMENFVSISRSINRFLLLIKTLIAFFSHRQLNESFKIFNLFFIFVAKVASKIATYWSKSVLCWSVSFIVSEYSMLCSFYCSLIDRKFLNNPTIITTSEVIRFFLRFCRQFNVHFFACIISLWSRQSWTVQLHCFCLVKCDAMKMFNEFSVRHET